MFIEVIFGVYKVDYSSPLLTHSSNLPHNGRTLCTLEYIGLPSVSHATCVLECSSACFTWLGEGESVRSAHMFPVVHPSIDIVECRHILPASLHVNLSHLWLSCRRIFKFVDAFLSCYVLSSAYRTIPSQFYERPTILHFRKTFPASVHFNNGKFLRTRWNCQVSFLLNLRILTITSWQNTNSTDHSSLTPDLGSLSVAEVATEPTTESHVGVVGGMFSPMLEPAPMEQHCPDEDAGGSSLESMEPSSSASTGSAPPSASAPSSRPKPGSTRAERREFFRKGNKKAQAGGATASSKRQRSDDSTKAPSTKRSAAPAKPPVPCSDLEVVITNKAVENGALTIEHIETIRFELSSLLLAQDPSEFGPEFEYVGSAGGWLDLRCKNAESKVWLVEKVGVLNGLLEGKADLSVRARSEMRTHRVSGLFPVPRKVEPNFVTGLLLRQNKNLLINTWRVIRFDEVMGKNPNQSSVGSGYFVLFEVDDASFSELKLAGFKVSFALTAVIMREYGKPSSTATQEVEKVDDMTDHVAL